MMKIFFFLVYLLSTLCIAQQNNFNKEYELQKFVERGGKHSEISPHIYKLTYPDGHSIIYNLNCINKIDNENVGVETTIINVWEIDTTLYANRFSFWQKVDIANDRLYPTFVADLNLNNLPELYGFSDRNRYPAPPTAGPVEIYELNNEGIFDSVYAYNSTTVFVHGLGDIHGTGRKEIFMRTRSTPNGDIYRSDTVGVLPTSYDFTFYYEPNQLNNMTFDDFDKNGTSDCAFVEGAGGQEVFIAEYRDSINNFQTVFHYQTTGQVEFSGFAIGDFDKDNLTDLVFGTGHGEIYLIENKGINTYEITWRGTFSTFNAYMKIATNDIDRNGKPEFWIGGQDFVEGITRFECFEANGDNSYEQVAMIELRYINSFEANYLQAADMDNDGIDELVISIGQLVLILKFDGSPNEHKYKIYYAKIGEQTQPGSTFYQANIYDLNGDEKKDIILPMDIYVNPNLVSFSYLLKQNYTTDVIKEINEATTYNLKQNYPNPFNPLTKIKFTIPEATFIKITVFDILGKEINTLFEEEISAGEYSISWNGTDNNGKILNSGVYFITMEAKSFQKTIKTILLK